MLYHFFTGGGCKLCGSVEHLRANCPKKHKSISGKSIFNYLGNN